MRKKMLIIAALVFLVWWGILDAFGYLAGAGVQWMDVTGYVMLGLLLAMLLYGVKAAPSGGYMEQAFSLKNSKAFQGFLAAFVILHHIYIILFREMDYKGSLEIFENTGVIIVGFFFFCSGYGLITSLKQKDNYLKGFMKKRVFTVLVPFFICNYAYMITTLLMGKTYSMDNLLYAFFGLKLLNSQMWFAVEILLLYICFYLIFRFIRRERTAFIVMGLTVIIMIIGSLLLGHDQTTEMIGTWFRGEWWYNTSFIFYIGMLAARFKEVLIPRIQKHFYLWLAVFYGLSIGLGFIVRRLLDEKGYWIESANYRGYAEKFQALAFQLPMVACCVAVILLIMMKITFYNKILSILGRISLEVILINNVFIVGFLKLAKNHIVLYVMLVFAATILAAIAIYRIKLWVLDKNE